MSAKKTERKTVGQRVREAREKLGLSQEDLARRAEVSTGLVSCIERGRPPRYGTLERLAAALGVPAAELIS